MSKHGVYGKYFYVVHSLLKFNKIPFVIISLKMSKRFQKLVIFLNLSAFNIVCKLEFLNLVMINTISFKESLWLMDHKVCFTLFFILVQY